MQTTLFETFDFSFKKKSGLDFREMLFFDDEHRNIVDLTRHGVKSILVNHGVNLKLVDEAVENF